MKPQKRKRGRPIVGNEAKSVVLVIRLTPKQKALLAKKASQSGKTMTEWICGKL